jgi:hypothetical protein
VQNVGTVQHAGPVQGQHRVQAAREGVHGKGFAWVVAQGPGAQQWIEVGAMVGVAVTDEHGVDLIGREARDDRVSGVDQEAESVVLQKIAAARLSGRRPRTAGTENC